MAGYPDAGQPDLGQPDAGRSFLAFKASRAFAPAARRWASWASLNPLSQLGAVIFRAVVMGRSYPSRQACHPPQIAPDGAQIFENARARVGHGPVWGVNRLSSGMPFRISGTSPANTVALRIEKAWNVRLRCDGCDKAPTIWAEDALTRLPPGATLGAVATRVRCAGCGSGEGELSKRQGHWGGRAAFARG